MQRMNGYMFCRLYMTQVQATTTSDSGSRHTSCTVLRAYSSADSRLRGMHLTPLRLCLLCSDLPPFQHTQLKVFFSSVVFQLYVWALHFTRDQFEFNYWGEKRHHHHPPQKLTISTLATSHYFSRGTTQKTMYFTAPGCLWYKGHGGHSLWSG